MPLRSTALSPRKTPRQERAKATVAAILQATAHILEHEGPDMLTTNRVAEKAGVSIGSLYQYFPTKEAIYAELIRNMRRGMRDDIRDALRFAKGQPLPFAIARLIRAVIHHHVHRTHLADVLEHLEAHLPPDPDARAIEAEAHTALSDHLRTAGIAEADLAAKDLLHLIIGIAHPALHDGETDFDHLASRIEPAALGYLGLAR